MKNDTLYYKWLQYFIKHIAVHRTAVKNKTEEAFESGYITNDPMWNEVYYDYIVNQGRHNAKFFDVLKLMLPIIVISPENVVDHKLLKQFRKDFPDYVYIANEIEEKNNLPEENR